MNSSSMVFLQLCTFYIFLGLPLIVAFQGPTLDRSSLRNKNISVRAVKSSDLLGLNDPVKIGEGGAPTFSEFLKAKFSGQELPDTSNEVLSSNIAKLSKQISTSYQNTQSLTELNSKALKESAAETAKAFSALKAGTASSSFKATAGIGAVASFVESLKPITDSLNLNEYGAYYAGGLIAIAAFGSSKSAKESQAEQKKKDAKKMPDSEPTAIVLEVDNEKSESTDKVFGKSEASEEDTRQASTVVPKTVVSTESTEKILGKSEASEGDTREASTDVPKTGKSYKVPNVFDYKSRRANKISTSTTSYIPQELATVVVSDDITKNVEIAIPEVASDEIAENVDIATPEALIKIKDVEEKTGKSYKVPNAFDYKARRTPNAAVDSPVYEENVDIDIEAAKRKVMEATKYAEKAAEQAKVAKDLSNEIIKSMSEKSGKTGSILEESKMSLTLVENEILEKKVVSLEDEMLQLQKLLSLREAVILEEKAKADEEAIKTCVALAEEEALTGKIKSLEKDNSNTSNAYKQLQEEKLAFEKQVKESESVFRSDAEMLISQIKALAKDKESAEAAIIEEKANEKAAFEKQVSESKAAFLSDAETLKSQIKALEKDKESAATAAKALEKERLNFEKEFNDAKALLESDKLTLKRQVEALKREMEMNIVSTTQTETTSTKVAKKTTKRSKAEEKVRALAAEVDTKEENEKADAAEFFFASTSNELHPFASLSSSALSRKPVKELVAFLEERGVGTVSDGGKTYLKKILLEKVKENL